MTRKQRQAGSGQSVTYDLNNSRNRAAFEALLDDEDESGTDPQQLPPRGKRGELQAKREKEKFFQLKDSQLAGKHQQKRQAAPNANQKEALGQLMDLFQGSAEPAVVCDVLAACAGNFEAAVDALLGMLGGAPPPAGAQAASGQASSSSAGGSSRASRPPSKQQQQQQAMPLSWSQLPADVKEAILGHLPLRELARAAPTCSEFCQRARHMRRHVQRLLLPAGLGYSGLVGMVAGHACASLVDLSRLERHIARLNAEELAPQVVAMHKQEAEASMFRAVVALAEASATPARQQQPITGLVMRGLVGATGRVLTEALSSLRHLRSLDLSHCPHLTNKTLYQLAKYRAEQQQQCETAVETEQLSDAEFDYEQYARANGYSSDAASSSDEWEQWPEEDLALQTLEDAEHPAAGSGRDGDVHEEVPEYEEETAALPAAAATAEAAVEDAALDQAEPDAAAATGGSSMQPSAANACEDGCNAAAAAAAAAGGLPLGPNPAVRDPLNSKLASAVTSRLAALQLHSQQQAAAAAAASAAAASGGLTELRLSGNAAFADDGLRQVLQGPATKHSLAVLDISGCKGFSSAGLVIPPLGVLRELRAARLRGLTQMVLHLPASHPLQHVDLSCCHFLRLVDVAMPQLTTLNLSACRTLYRLRMRCPFLTSLSLAQCGSLVDLFPDAWQVPALEQLNLFGCRRASGLQLQAVLQSLPQLRSIDLNGCWNMHNLHLTAQLQLESVDITGCRSLGAFSSSSPCLTELSASACGRLHSLTLASRCMRLLQLANCSHLSEVHVAAAAPPPPPLRTAAAAAAAAGDEGVDSRRGQSAAAAGGPRGMHSSGVGGIDGRGSGKRAVAGRGAGGGRGLVASGCSSLSPDARARLAAAVAVQR